MSLKSFYKGQSIDHCKVAQELYKRENPQDYCLIINGIIAKDKGLEGAGSACVDLLCCKQLK